MATVTYAPCLVVIYLGIGQPCRSGVTRSAIVSGRDMARTLTFRHCPVMTGYAGCGGLGMIHFQDGRPFCRRRGVTSCTNSAGRGMFRTLAASFDTIMTVNAVALDLFVVHFLRWRPFSRRQCMTGKTIVSRVGMRQTLTLAYCAVVARHTITEHFFVIDGLLIVFPGRRENRVAGFAAIGRRRMRDRFRHCSRGRHMATTICTRT